jgi:hypothetical protein
MLGARARIVVAACHHPQPPISSESISIQWFTRRISLRHWFAYSAPTTCVLQSGILPCSKHLTHPTWRRSPGAMRRSCSACRGSVTAPRCRRPDKVSNRAPVKPQTAGRQTRAGRHSSHFCTGERGLERYSSRISDLKIGEMLPERRSRGTSHSTPATYSFPESFSSFPRSRPSQHCESHRVAEADNWLGQVSLRNSDRSPQRLIRESVNFRCGWFSEVQP